MYGHRFFSPPVNAVALGVCYIYYCVGSLYSHRRDGGCVFIAGDRLKTLQLTRATIQVRAIFV